MDVRRKFLYCGHEYVESTRGYYYRDGRRISAADFRDAKRSERERSGRLEALANRAGKEEEMNVIDIDGIEYRNDWTNGRYYRGDEEISRAEFLQAMGSGYDRPSRRRRSKDVAFEYEGVTLTSRQVDFLHAMSSESSQGSPDGGWRIDLLIGGTGLSPMSAGAMVSTLREKGLIEVSVEHREDSGRKRKVKAVCLTEAGHAIWDAIGLRRQEIGDE